MPVDRWQQLDDARYDDPAAVVAEVARLIAERRFDRRELYRALAVSASAHRLMGELDVAHRQLALAFVEARDRPEALGDLLQRFSYVVADRGDHFGAYRLTQRAMRAHSFTGDRVGVGKALVDQGLWLERLGRVEVAVMAFEAALKHWLPRGTAVRHRLSAFQGLAVCHQKLGRPRLAAKFLERALASGARLGGLERAKLVAFQGTVAKDAGEYGEAEGFLEAALEQYRGVPSPLDWALVSVELVRVQLLRGDAAAAYTSARRMPELVEALKRNKVASAAVCAIARCGFGAKGLSLALVERVHGELAEERAAVEKRSQKAAARRRRRVNR